MSTAIIIDTETTDVQDCEVMELAWKHLGAIGSFRKLYKPEKLPKWGAVAIHHIIPADVADCSPSSTAPGDVPPATYWIGHNIDFDWRALGSPPGVKRICTLAFSRSLWPECDSHSLGAMMYFTQGMNSHTQARVRLAHSALDDVLMCESILKTIMEVAKIDDLETLWEESEEARIPRVWTFGKFKGQPIGAADRGYANWCRKQPDFDPYVLQALKREGL